MSEIKVTISGLTGCGKTTIGSIIAKALIEANYFVEFRDEISNYRPNGKLIKSNSIQNTVKWDSQNPRPRNPIKIRIGEIL